MTGKPARIREAERLLGIETPHAQRMKLAAERKAEREAAWKPMTPEELDRWGLTPSTSGSPANGPAPAPSPGFGWLWQRVTELRRSAGLTEPSATTETVTEYVPIPNPFED